MGKILETNEFSRNGQKGMRVTIQQRAVSKRSAEAAVVPQIAARFPLKATGVHILGSKVVNPIAGPLKMYHVDVFVPISKLQKPPTKSGDVNANQIT